MLSRFIAARLLSLFPTLSISWGAPRAGINSNFISIAETSATRPSIHHKPETTISIIFHNDDPDFEYDLTAALSGERGQPTAGINESFIIDGSFKLWIDCCRFEESSVTIIPIPGGQSIVARHAIFSILHSDRILPV